MSWYAVAAAVAAAAVSSYNTSKTASKQDKIIAQGIRKQSEEQRLANSQINKTIANFENSSSEPIASQLSGDMRKQLMLKRAQALAGLQQSGGVSDAAVQAAQKAGLNAGNYGGELAGLFGRIDAPIEQRRREHVDRINLGDDLSVRGRNSRAQEYLTNLRLRGVQRNPWMDMLSAGLSGYAGAAGGGGSIAGSGMVGGSQLTPQQFYSASSAASLPGMQQQSGQLFKLFGP